jgi:hypothetical protein
LGVSVVLWGTRHPYRLDPLKDVLGWHLDASANAQIDRILNETINDPVGPEFMARRYGRPKRRMQSPDLLSVKSCVARSWKTGCLPHIAIPVLR